MSEPTGKISASEAEILSDAWTKLRQEANNNAAEQEDNRSSWYSLEDMEAFIKMIKDKNPNVNGVRCYLGVQTDKANPKGLTTIFMVPTEDVNGKNIDIKGADGIDRGQGGMPPGAGYPN
ncbi:hypothetical protein [Olleya marilimosa]|uniref:hypothetical protein n=1 Tax=Olleya marilimosa TaxID=272164 RepID=UPI000C1584B0|nr:hypothetical protein [Olleya marilimosa]MBD3889652.1 hypothetical protein [Olleya marilimosa]PIB32081.1 hypothetical protein BFP78_09480 [Gaetbulibacter sp. 5U11]|tara:strand:+ start:193 stop:552 length:360 start_codon:yes stop_codon:yes gene_type:complete